jgi:drug/metabolite transporter (DMT)-like permease
MAIASTRGLIAGATIFALTPKTGFKEYTRVHLMASLCYALLSVTFIFAMKLTTVANTLALQFTAPVWVAILAPFFLRERTRLYDWIFMALIFGGVFLFFQGGLSREGFWGNILALASGFFFGAQAMCLRSIKEMNPASAIVAGNIFTFLMGAWFFRPPWPDFNGVLMLLALGVFQMGISYFLYTIAVPYVTSLELVVITMAEPILSPLWAFLVIGERPSGHALLGGVIVLGGVLVWSMIKLRAAPDRIAPPQEA